MKQRALILIGLLALAMAPLLSAESSPTPQQINDCVALQYLLNPPKSVEIKAAYLAGRTTNVITWTVQDQDWKMTGSPSYLGTGVFGHGRSGMSQYSFQVDEMQGVSVINEDHTPLGEEDIRERFEGYQMTSCRVATLGLAWSTVGNLVMHQGKLIHRDWLNHPDLAWSMGDITLDGRGRLKSIRWRSPEDFKEKPEGHFLYEYNYSPSRTNVATGLPTGWLARIVVEDGAFIDSRTEVTWFQTGDTAKPEKASPATIENPKFHFIESPEGGRKLQDGQWVPYGRNQQPQP